MKIAFIFTEREAMADNYPEDWVGRTATDDIDAVIKSLKELGHEVIKYPANLELIEKLKLERKNLDLAFDLCDDGFFSNAQLEPHLPAVLDFLGIPYTGSGYLSLALCLNKARAKKLFVSNDIPTPKFQIFSSKNDELKKGLEFPLIVKPIAEDASIGIKDESIVHNENELKKRICLVLQEYNQAALAEEFIEGREFNVGIVGDEVFPISEIIFDSLPENKPHIFNYDAKWDEKSIENKKIKKECPAKIDIGLENKLISIALRASNALLCRGYVRVDFRVDKDGNPFVLEVNPNPDLSPEDILALMAKAKNYSYTELIKKIISSALERNKKIKN